MVAITHYRLGWLAPVLILIVASVMNIFKFSVACSNRLQHAVLSKALRTVLIVQVVLASLFSATNVHAGTQLHLLAWRASDVQLWRYISEQALIPDVTVSVTVVPVEQYGAVQRGEFGQLNVNAAPDILQTQAALGWLLPLSSQNKLLPLDNVSLDQVLPAGLSTVSGADGRVFGIPFGMQMASVVYNQQLFTANGWSVPTTASQWIQLLKQADQAGLIPLFVAGSAGWWTSQILHETVFAGRVPAQIARGIVAGTACFTDPEVVTALADVASWRRYMNAKPAVASYQDMQSAFALGDAAMIVDGQWATDATSRLFQIAPELQMGTFPIPGRNGQVATFATGGYVGLAQTPNPAAVRQVMAFMTSEAFAQLSMDLTGDIPAYSGNLVINDARTAAIAAEIVDNGYGVHLVSAPQLNGLDDQFAGLLATGFQQLLSGQVTAAEMAAAVQQGLNKTGYAGAVLCDF